MGALADWCLQKTAVLSRMTVLDEILGLSDHDDAEDGPSSAMSIKGKKEAFHEERLGTHFADDRHIPEDSRPATVGGEPRHSNFDAEGNRQDEPNWDRGQERIWERERDCERGGRERERARESNWDSAPRDSAPRSEGAGGGPDRHDGGMRAGEHPEQRQK